MSEPGMVEAGWEAAWQRAFQGWIEQRGSAQTRRGRMRIVGKFLAFCDKKPEAVRVEDVRGWRTWLEEEEYAESTIRTYLATLKSFYMEAGRQGLAETNPVTAEALPKTRPYASGRYLSEEEEAALLKAIDVETVWGKRDYALILFLLRSGKRTGEILGLRWGDFEVGKSGVWYRSGKGGELTDNEVPVDGLPVNGLLVDKLSVNGLSVNELSVNELTGGRPEKRTRGDQRRWARLDWEVWAAICSYLEGCGRLETMQEDEFIFTPLTDAAGRVEKLYGDDWRKHALAAGSVGRSIQMYARWAGLAAEEITPKALRYTAAARKLSKGCSLEELSKFMGHSDGDVTRVWVREVIGDKAKGP